MKPFCGFTLAEVLITLGIIGVVAAMTLPTLVASYQKKVLTVQIKKVMSLFSQAQSMAVADYGDASNWVVKRSDTVATDYILEKLKAKNCGRNITNNTEYQNSVKSTTYDGNNIIWNKCKTLNDGTIIFYSYDGFSTGIGQHVTCSPFLVDVNGLKKPNQYGKDILGFSMFYTVKVNTPGDYIIGPGISNITLTSKSRPGIYASGSGYEKKRCTDLKIYWKNYSCPALLQKNNWEFPKDYPW